MKPPANWNDTATIAREMHERIDAATEQMTPSDVARAIRRHIRRLQTRQASSIPSSVLERAADFLDDI